MNNNDNNNWINSDRKLNLLTVVIYGWTCVDWLESYEYIWELYKVAVFFIWHSHNGTKKKKLIKAGGIAKILWVSSGAEASLSLLLTPRVILWWRVCW